MASNIPGNIRDLPKDIYALLESPGSITDKDADDLGKSIASVVRASLVDQSKSGLRMSNYGSPCRRQLWYKVNKPELGEKLDGKTLSKFIYGHVIEALILWYAKLTKKHTIEGEQDTLEYEGILGHRDAIIDGMTADVKSANSRGMGKFRDHTLEHDDPFGYLDQLSLYSVAGREDDRVKVKKQAAFIAVDKENGDIVVDVYKTKDITQQDVLEVKQVLASPEPPPRAFVSQADGKSGNESIPFQCTYCQYKHTCWPGLRGFAYSTGIRWLTKVVRQPDVPEVHKET